jgi:hypothetical protein
MAASTAVAKLDASESSWERREVGIGDGFYAGTASL